MIEISAPTKVDHQRNSQKTGIALGSYLSWLSSILESDVFSLNHSC